MAHELFDGNAGAKNLCALLRPEVSNFIGKFLARLS
jgi:hypothetical protein